MYKILNGQVAVLATSVDLTLSSRPSCGADANQQKLVTVRSHVLRITEGKSSLSEQPGFCEVLFELRWAVVPGFEPGCS